MILILLEMVLLMNSFEDMIKEAELASRKTEDIIYDEFNNVGIECVAEIKANEPVVTGNLRRSITSGEVELNGNEYSMAVGSSLSYARYVEEDHKQEVGRYVPAIGKKLKKEFVPGNHVIKDSVDLYQPKLIKRIQERVEKEV